MCFPAFNPTWHLQKTAVWALPPRKWFCFAFQVRKICSLVNVNLGEDVNVDASGGSDDRHAYMHFLVSDALLGDLWPSFIHTVSEVDVVATQVLNMIFIRSPGRDQGHDLRQKFAQDNRNVMAVPIEMFLQRTTSALISAGVPLCADI